MEQLTASRPCRERDLVIAMIADRAQELERDDVDVHEFYKAMDWLLEQQNRIENKLAKRHLKGGAPVLFDVSSSYYTRQKSSLREYGYSRDHCTVRTQIAYGLLCDAGGRPISIEVLPGKTADPNAFRSLVQRRRKSWGTDRVIFVGDRGMITSKRIHEDFRETEGMGWISALRTEGIRDCGSR